MNKRKLMVLVISFAMLATLIPTQIFAAKKTKTVETYVFFGSDSRKNDDSWKSNNGAKITADKSGTQGTPRSDVIMIFKINNKKKTVEIASVYRDTMLDVTGKGKDFQKINMAYANHGPKKAMKILAKNLNIKIDGYVCTNFKGVADAVDALGGITVNIEKDKIMKAYQTSTRKNVPQTMNVLIDEMNRVYGRSSKHVKKAGKQKLDGIQSVAYARVRYTDGGDLRRSVRQRTVFTTMLKKYKKSSAVKKATILAGLYQSIDSSLSETKLLSLFKRASKYKLKRKIGFPYYKTGYTRKTKKEIGGTSYMYVPCDLTKNVVKLHKSFFGQKKYKASKVVKSYSKKIYKISKKNYKKRTKSYDNKY